jgi:hypothetical protein
MSDISEDDWSDDIEKVLESIRINSNNLYQYHKDKYYYYKSQLKYFKLPIIILTSLTSVASVGLTTYISQNTVSLLTCLLSLTSALIGSIELYLGIQKNMENEIDVSKQFQLLAYDIYKTCSLKRQNRQVNGRSYLDNKYNEYVKLTEQANMTISKAMKDIMAPVDDISFGISIKESPKFNINNV